MYQYITQVSRALTCQTPEHISTWRKGSVVHFKVEAPAPRHVMGAITNDGHLMHLRAWIYEGSSEEPNAFLDQMFDPGELYYWLDRCLYKLYESPAALES